MIIDFHSHVLPGIDDGSQSAEMSLEMLRASVKQGVDGCIATPHFYGNRQTLASFLENRKNAWEAIRNDAPLKVLLGAEVAYFPGISAAEGLEELRTEGTDLLLFELPYAPWNETVLRETAILAKKHHLILAHLERYLDFTGNVKYIERIQKEMPVEIQLNAGSMTRWLKRMKIQRHIKKTYLLGSDMHNLTERPQNLSAGRERLNAEMLARVDELGTRLTGPVF